MKKDDPFRCGGKEAAMTADCCRKVFAGLLTTVAAPVLVSVIVQQLGTAPRAAPATPPPPGDSEPRDIVVSHGIGNTPAEARREAMRAALLQTASSLNDGAEPSATDRATCDAVLSDPREVVLRCEDLGGRKQMEAGRTWYYQEISVELARACLARRLLAARMELVAR
jgi:hypothetical protein